MLGLKCLKEIAKFAFFSGLAALPACYHGDTFGMSKYTRKVISLMTHETREAAGEVKGESSTTSQPQRVTGWEHGQNDDL